MSDKVHISYYDHLKQMVKAGVPVYWKNKGYELLGDRNDQYVVQFSDNQSAIGLHGIPDELGMVSKNHAVEDFIY